MLGLMDVSISYVIDHPDISSICGPKPDKIIHGEVSTRRTDDARECRGCPCSPDRCCRECSHQVEPDPAEMARRYGTRPSYSIGRTVGIDERLRGLVRRTANNAPCPAVFQYNRSGGS
jgi:hypothetical protein